MRGRVGEEMQKTSERRPKREERKKTDGREGDL